MRSRVVVHHYFETVMKRKFLLVISFCWLLATAAWGQEGAAAGVAEAKAALANDDFANARKLFEAAYKENPSDTAVCYGLAETYLRMQEAGKAEDFVEKALKQFPDNAILHLKLGIAFNLKGKFKKAEEEFVRVDELLAKDDLLRQTLYINHGIAVLGREKPEEATPWFDKAIGVNPRNATAYNYKGSTLYRLEDYDGALRSFNTSLDIDLQNPISLYNRGMTYLKLEDHAKACLDFHAACRKGNMNACKQIVVVCKQKEQ